MVEPTPSPRPRSGCALALGVTLITIGLVFLLQNFVDYSFVRVLRAAIRLFADYWPVALVVWGTFKVYRHVTAPERSRVTAVEIFLLFLLVGTGLTLRATVRFLDRIGTESPFDELFSLAGVEVLRGPVHRFHEEQSYDLGPDARLVFESPRSGLRVTGWDEPRLSVSITKLVHDPSEEDAARLAAEVGLRYDEPGGGIDAGDSGARLAVVAPGNREPGRVDVDVELHVPRTTALTIRNRGRVEVSDLTAPLAIETADAAIEVRSVTGALSASTRHGDVRVENASGGASIQNQDGNIRISNLTGELKADTSHGTIQAEGLKGKAVVSNRHGSIQLARVSGGVEVQAEHTEVSVESAGKSVRIATSHQPVFVHGVDGDVTIDATGSAVQALEIGGNVTVVGRGEPVTVARARGTVSVKSSESRVTADDIGGPLSIETSNEDVRVGEFASTLDVRSMHGKIHAGTSHLAGNVELRTSYGEIELRLPADAALHLMATTRDGEARSRIPGLELHPETENDTRTWVGTLGAGTYEVTLETSYGDVLVGVPES